MLYFCRWAAKDADNKHTQPGHWEQLTLSCISRNSLGQEERLEFRGWRQSRHLSPPSPPPPTPYLLGKLLICMIKREKSPKDLYATDTSLTSFNSDPSCLLEHNSLSVDFHFPVFSCCVLERVISQNRIPNLVAYSLNNVSSIDCCHWTVVSELVLSQLSPPGRTSISQINRTQTKDKFFLKFVA